MSDTEKRIADLERHVASLAQIVHVLACTVKLDHAPDCASGYGMDCGCGAENVIRYASRFNHLREAPR